MNVRRMKDGWTPVFLAATFGTSQVVRWVSGSQRFRFRREFQVQVSVSQRFQERYQVGFRWEFKWVSDSQSFRRNFRWFQVLRVSGGISGGWFGCQGVLGF